MLHGNGAAAASVQNIVPVQLTPASPTLGTVAGGYSLATPTKVSGGTGYTANDVLTLVGGTKTITAQITVLTVTAGVVTTFSVSRIGDYSVKPTSTISTTGGTGTGATFTATWNDVHATYYTRLTYVFAFGEQLASPEASQVVAAGTELVITSPVANSYATGYNVYLNSSSGTNTKQNGSTPVAIGTSWTLPSSGMISGASLPTALAIDMAVSENWLATVSDNFTLSNPANLAAGRMANLWITQDGTGSRVCTYGSQWQAAGSVSTIALTTTASAKDFVAGVADTTSTITTRISKAISH